MIQLCRVCDNANSEDRVRFIGTRRNEPVFQLDCEHCGMVTEMDAKGDLCKSEAFFGG